jgi:hypothetical protein
MINRIGSIVFLCLIVCLGAFCFELLTKTQNRNPNRPLRSIGYVSHFLKNKRLYLQQFRKKISSPPPVWMQRQIENDLCVKKISLSAIESTQQVIREKKIEYTNRYRIVNRKLYRYLDPITSKIQEKWSEEQRAPIDWFEMGIKTLLEMASIPNLDFIVTHRDGTFEPFYLVEDPSNQAPILGWAKLKSTPYLVLIPDYRSLSSVWYNDIKKLREEKYFNGPKTSWDHKQPAAFWRGALTEPIHRLQIAVLSNQFPNLIDAGIIEGNLFSQLKKPPASYEEHLQYKYLPVLDGVMCTYPGYQWRLLSDAVVFKQESDQIQWFYGALEPFVHYVPIKQDLSDLVERICWARANDNFCKKISANATDFATKNLMYDDVYCYLYYVLIAYSRLLDRSFESDWDLTDSWVEL